MRGARGSGDTAEAQVGGCGCVLGFLGSWFHSGLEWIGCSGHVLVTHSAMGRLFPEHYAPCRLPILLSLSGIQEEPCQEFGILFRCFHPSPCNPFRACYVGSLAAAEWANI